MASIPFNGEPSIDELLTDPICKILMRYDGLEEGEVRRQMAHAARRLFGRKRGHAQAGD